MTKKEICNSKVPFAYCSELNGIEFFDIEYGINDYIYCVSNVNGEVPKYHKLKIRYSEDECNDATSYIVFGKYKVYFNNCFRI